MAFFKVSTEEDKIKDSANSSSFINKSGFYPVKILHALVNVSPNGSQSLDLVVDYEGQEQVLFSAIRLTNRNGEENFGASLLHKLCIIAGAKDGEELADPVPVMLKLGRNSEEREYMELADLIDTDVTLRIQMEYTRYEGKIYENRRIRNLFRTTDNATASEIVNETEKGKQYKEEEEYMNNLEDKNTYKDGITAEDVAIWKKERRSNNTSTDDQPKKTFQRHTFGRSAA